VLFVLCTKMGRMSHVRVMTLGTLNRRKFFKNLQAEKCNQYYSRVIGTAAIFMEIGKSF
jgi:hypothetical protein